jgi:tetratricopeptide (TPR) repeat protein
MERRPSLACVAATLLAETREWRRIVALLEPLAEPVNAAPPCTLAWRAIAWSELGRASRARADATDALRRVGQIAAPAADDLVARSRALDLLGRTAAANQSFEEALAADASSLEVRIAWAAFFMRNHRPDEAARLIEEVRDRALGDPRALAVAARAAIESANDYARAEALLDAASRLWSKHPETLEALARIDLEAGDPAAALARLEPLSPAARSHWTAQAVGFTAERLRRPDTQTDAAERAMPDDRARARFLWAAGILLEHAFRYPQARELYDRAVTRDPTFAPALAAAAMAASRTGDEDRARALFERAAAADPFIEEAFHARRLFDERLADYVVMGDPHQPSLRYRFHRDEAPALGRLLPSAAREAWATYRDRYQFEPEGPVSVEVFADPETFGVRSVGLPGLPVHGVCFGHLVTMRSPNTGDFNWRQVVSHEISHVFSLQLSNYRVPRWFSEGLAELDTLLSRPEWERDEDLLLVAQMRADSLPRIDRLDRVFLRARTTERVVAAYAQSRLVLQWIVAQRGVEALPGMVRQFGAGLSSTEVIERVTGTGIDEAQQAFTAWLVARLGPLVRSIEFDPEAYVDLSSLDRRQNEAPDDPVRAGDFALGLALAGDPRSGAALDRALSLDTRSASSLWALVNLRTRAGDVGAARDALERFFAAGHDSYSARVLAAEVSERLGLLTSAQEHLRAAAAFAPRGVEAATGLARLGAGATWAQVAGLDEMSADAALRAAEASLSDRDLEGAAHWAAQLLDIAPLAPAHLDLDATVAEQQGHWDRAVRDLSILWELAPARREEVRGRFAQALRRNGLGDEARRLEAGGDFTPPR